MRLHEYLTAENNFLLFYFTSKHMREQGIYFPKQQSLYLCYYYIYSFNLSLNIYIFE